MAPKTFSQQRYSSFNSDSPGIDMTPMLDVVFILLIFFVVTASFVLEKTIGMESSQNKPDKTAANESLLIEVNSENLVSIDGREVSLFVLRSLIAAKQPSSVVVKAHHDSSTSTYMKIADAARQAHLNQVALVTY